MKKIISVMICAALMLSVCGCANDEKQSTETTLTIPTEQTIGETHPAWSDPVTAIPEDFGMENSLDNPVFAEVFDHTDTAPLDKLVAFCLIGDGLIEGAVSELYCRFVSEPNTVLTFLALLGDQTYELTDLGEVSIAERTCKNIAGAAAAWYGDSTEFADAIAQCRENDPEERIGELLDVLEREYDAAKARNPS